MTLNKKFTENDCIFVTGGTGSLGKALITTLLRETNISRLVIFSRDEQKQYDFNMQLDDDQKGRVRFFIGDVRDRERLTTAMSNVTHVVHAAAMKIVPTAEYNPFECIQTNVIGAENVVQSAIARGVKNVIALSTDKACNPINLYGASKLASDKIFVAGNHLAAAEKTRFSVVRYGNVIGSRGSVLPFFKGLIERGHDHLPITDPKMTRFWITLEQGVSFVLSSLLMMRGGEIFVPKIPSMRITDLASALAPDLPQRIIGIRPGEKLHEIMISRDDARLTFDIGDRYVIEPSSPGWDTDRIGLNGDRVDENFEYASDSNSDWLDSARLLGLIA